MLGRRQRKTSRNGPNALVAAATRVQLDDRKMAQRQAAKRQAWQDEAWAYFDEVPELKYSVWFLGNAIAKLVLYPATHPPGAPADADPIPVDDDDSGLPPDFVASCQAELDRLKSTQGGLSAMLRRLNMNLEVAAECYLVGRGEIAPDEEGKGGRPEEWMIRSVSEVEAKQGVFYVKNGPEDTKGEPIDADTDTCIRLWQEHPRWAGLADCAMRGVLGECKILQVLSQQVLAQAMRAASAGFLTLPNELSFGSATPTEGEEGEDAGTDPFMDVMARVLLNPIEDPSDPASVQPGLIRGPGEFLKPDYLRHLTLWDKDVDDSLEARIKARVDRLARGLNLPVEVVMGHQQTTFANAEQVDQDTYEDHLESRCVLIVDALTVGYLRPNLLDAGYPADLVDRAQFWFDPSALVAQPDVEGNADAAHAKFVISDAAYRRAKGYTEDDAPEPMEVLIRSGLQRGILTAELTAALLQALADEANVDLPSAPAELQPGQPPMPGGGGDEGASVNLRTVAEMLLAAQALRASGRPPRLQLPGGDARGRGLAAAAAPRTGPDYGARLAAIDRDLRTRLLVAANDAMGRALEKAGNRMRSKANGHREVLRNVPAHLVASTLGPSIALTAASEEEAFAGAWDELERQFMTWGEQAQEEALELASQASSGFTTAERVALKLRQADDLGTGWSWFQEALQALAGERLFDPDPQAPDMGEFDATLRVPPGMVRQAMAQAGGGVGLLTTDAGGAFISLADAGSRPAGGIGTGELLRGTMRDHGVATEGYRWVYGQAHRSRPFKPHQRLDGIEFANFDDPRLANHKGWPSIAFYLPGDHKGCICDVEPILIPPDAGAAPAGDRFPDGDLAISKVNEWMVDRWGIDSDGKKRAFVFDGMGKEAANLVARDLDRLMAMFPETAKRIRVAGSSSQVTKAVRARYPGWRVPNIGKAYADAQSQTGWLRFNASRFSKMDELRASLTRNQTGGWLAHGTPQGIVTHEFGHHVYYRAKELGGPALTAELEQIRALHAARFVADGHAAPKARYLSTRDDISQYASKNNDELIAESFAMVYGGPGGKPPTQLARDLVAAVLRYAEPQGVS